ncbi:hypothetical protein FB45DRAFT_1060469 [Roridomyces roridus]|uniref:Uncharacterized protein n=1 Tax=Roridomyces roridus TaxID=1738132 RepID=A0AAD7FKX4_9AGAR|nr:hypothetical protein FB45DRAFT_1060469 [Roridomyces roridus]
MSRSCTAHRRRINPIFFKDRGRAAIKSPVQFLLSLSLSLLCLSSHTHYLPPRLPTNHRHPMAANLNSSAQCGECLLAYPTKAALEDHCAKQHPKLHNRPNNLGMRLMRRLRDKQTSYCSGCSMAFGAEDDSNSDIPTSAARRFSIRICRLSGQFHRPADEEVYDLSPGAIAAANKVLDELFSADFKRPRADSSASESSSAIPIVVVTAPVEHEGEEEEGDGNASEYPYQSVASVLETQVRGRRASDASDTTDTTTTTTSTSDSSSDSDTWEVPLSIEDDEEEVVIVEKSPRLSTSSESSLSSDNSERLISKRSVLVTRRVSFDPVPVPITIADLD